LSGVFHKSSARRAERRTLTLEALENRCLLAVGPVAGGALATPPADVVVPLNLVVTTLADKLDVNPAQADLSLRDALALTNNNAGAANMITFDPSLSGGEIDLTLGELAITGSVSIEGPGAAILTINAEQQSGVFNVNDGSDTTNSDVQISGLTLTGGSQANGGALYSTENLALDSVTVTGNNGAVGQGGGIFLAGGGNATVNNCSISDNSAQYGGGIAISGSGNVTIQQSTISGNSATPSATQITGQTNYGGGGIITDGTGQTTIQNCTISGNTAFNAGGGATVGDRGTTTIENSTISGNVSGGGGGGLYLATAGTATVQNATVAGNTAAYAAGILICDSAPTGATAVEASTISGNTATAAGGGIFIETPNGGNNAIESCTISGNSADSGGGVCFSEGVTEGDGITALTTIQDCTIAQNSAHIGGGGDVIISWGTLSIQNSTITANRSTLDQSGGGWAGGLNMETDKPSLVSLSSTIVAGNTDQNGVAPDLSGPVTLSNCLVGDGTGSGLTEAPVGAPDVNGNLVGGPLHGVIDPKLGSLADNGGPTETCALLAGSPAIDMGSNPVSLAYDQRGEGYPRVLGAQADIGAFEAEASLGLPTITSISPIADFPAGGRIVTITGTNLQGATQVLFGGVPATIQSDTDTQITVIDPPGSNGMVDVTVTTAGGTSPITSADRFIYSTSCVGPPPSIGLYDPGISTFLLRNSNNSGFADTVYKYGAADSDRVPIVGDWNGDGIQSIGLYDPSTSTFYLRNHNGPEGANDQGYADVVFTFGPAHSKDIPVVGDWNGDGTESIGLYDPATSTFYLRNSNSLQGPTDHGYADIVFNYGAPDSHMLPVTGDWDGTGRCGIGLYSQDTSTFYLREATQLQGPSDYGFADVAFNYGAAQQNLLPIAGDWNGDGQAGVGLYDRSTSMFYLRNAVQLQGSSDQGFADLAFAYGSGGSELPLAGRWTVGEPISVPLTTAEPGGTSSSPTTLTIGSDCVHVTAPTPGVQTPPMGGTSDFNAVNRAASLGQLQISSASCIISNGQSQVVNVQALNSIDPSSVASDVVGTQSLASVADDLSGTLVGALSPLPPGEG
jgi:parallel beta-helix repeat protein